jgi:hypothetical protein
MEVHTSFIVIDFRPAPATNEVALGAFNPVENMTFTAFECTHIWANHGKASAVIANHFLESLKSLLLLDWSLIIMKTRRLRT